MDNGVKETNLATISSRKLLQKFIDNYVVLDENPYQEIVGIYHDVNTYQALKKEILRRMEKGSVQ